MKNAAMLATPALRPSKCRSGRRGALDLLSCMASSMSILRERTCRARAELMAHDQIDDLFQIRIADLPVHDVLAFVHHADAVAHEEQVLQAVTDQDHADTALADRAHEFQHRFDFGDRKSTRLNSSHANISY